MSRFICDRKWSILIALCLTAAVLSGPALASGESSRGASADIELTEYGPVDMSRWQYNEANDVFWQVGISYCETPADTSCENLGIYIPGAYMTGTPNGDGTYTCTVNAAGTVAGFTAATAPIVFPVNTPGHSAQSAPTGYVSGSAKYTDAGFIYVSADCRGKDVGCPAGVVDLKAAIRYIRANLDVLPGCGDRIVPFGMSGGGSQTAVLGTTGDSELYAPYLEAIGAAETSDAVAAAMCWCPITGLDSADEGHEWSMGVTRSDLDAEFQSYSDVLAAAYAGYVNATGFTDADGAWIEYDAGTNTVAISSISYGADVDFETVWGLGHTQAERTGDSDANFIAWVQGLWA